MNMKLYRTLSTAAISGALSLGLAGVALADADISNTGPDSNNQATTNNSNTINWTDNSSVTVTNTNNQTATSGDAEVVGNTNGGSATTGEASNTNIATTTINMASSGPVGGGNLPGGNNGGGNQGGGNVGTGGQGGGHVHTGGVGGGRLGMSSGGGVGGGLLPETGPEGQMDVSSLRNAVSESPSADLVKQSNRMSTLLLAAGALLSLLGAVGSAVYAHKQEVKVRG
jgi:hypothetical protein